MATPHERAQGETMQTRVIPVIAVLLIAACGNPAPRVEQHQQPATAERPEANPAPSPAEPPPTGTDTIRLEEGRWTAGLTAAEHEVTGVATLAEIRTARHDGFDRIVYVFRGDEIPSYRIEYVDRPVRDCGSGDPIPIAGDGWLSMHFTPARSHDDEGRATVTERNRRPALPNLLQLRATCDFEAHLEWVAGVGSPNRYRVLELREPARVVVDIRH